MAQMIGILVGFLFLASNASAAVPPDVAAKLASSEHVYISSTRKNGSLSKPAEIWFHWHEGAVYVATPADTWRAKRIRAGRPDAKIAVGRPDGPSFTAKGEIVKDAKIDGILLQTFAKKYPKLWESYEDRFRSGLADGSRVVICYTPK